MALMAASFMNRNLEDERRAKRRHKQRNRSGSDARLPKPHSHGKPNPSYHNQTLLTVPGALTKHKRSISQPDINRLIEIRTRHKSRGKSPRGSEEGLSDGSSHSPTPPSHHHHPRSRGNSDTPIPPKMKHRSKSRTPMEEGESGGPERIGHQHRAYKRRTSEDAQYGKHATLMILHPAEPGQATRKRSMSIAGSAPNGMTSGNRNPFGKLWRQMQKLKIHQNSPEEESHFH